MLISSLRGYRRSSYLGCVVHNKLVSWLTFVNCGLFHLVHTQRRSNIRVPFGVPLYGYNGARDDKQNGVEENFQVVYLQNRKVLEE